MKYIIALLLFPIICLAQEEDTLVTVKKSFYMRSMFMSLTSGHEKVRSLTERISQNVEFGESFGVIDVGLALGNLNWKASDSSKYVMGRVTMDACQYGIFSNDITVGTGYLFDSKTPIMLELSSTLFAQIGEKWGMGFVFGTYEFIGDTNEYSKNFFGLYFRWGLMRSEGGVLMNRVRAVQRTKRHVKRKRIM